ncbi:MAG: FAD-dependent monooxygenase [Desulfobacterales bacterium]|nr:FAD-dependent monooxygenase [Desulfobacterales bacterium]
MKTALPRDIDVVIIGAGPVGLTASLLLNQWRIAHIVVEAQDPPSDHPQAHFISARSMEIFRELGVEEKIRNAAAPLDEWCRHVYATRLAERPRGRWAHDASPSSLLGVIDHFSTGPDHRISPSWESNLSQPLLQDLLRSAVANRRNGRLLMGWRAEVREKQAAVDVVLRPAAGGREHRLRCQYVICADGAHSASRERLGIGRIQRTPTLQHLLNIHFFSPTLAALLRRRPTAMLYFVYAPQGVGVFVNHSLSRGEFVLQLPYFPPFENPEAFDHRTCAEIIDQLAGAPARADIRSIRTWRLEAWVAQRFHSRRGRCFLVGDAAHQILPAGGFGMNTGIAEAHNLAWKLARVLWEEKSGARATAQTLLATYDSERRPLAEKAIALSRINFEKTLTVGAAIGLSWRAACGLQRLMERLPLPAAVRGTLFRAGMQMGRNQVRLLDCDNPIGRFRRRRVRALLRAPAQLLPMRFPHQDLGAVYRRSWRPTRTGANGPPGASGPIIPTWQTGARLPHFRLRQIGASANTRISSIDLAGIAGRRHGVPVYVLLIFGPKTDAAPELVDTIAPRFKPFETVHIGRSGDLDAPVDYVLDPGVGSDGALPPAALVRPDGHLAWVAPSAGREETAIH